MIASHQGRIEVVRLLVRRGANADLAANDGGTALSLAANDSVAC